MTILSLDVSAAKTGWAYTADGYTFTVGTIETKPKYNRSERLVTFNSELTKLLETCLPTHVVIEDTFSGKNVKTLKILSEFAGVAKFTCAKVLGFDPTIVANTTVKKFYKTKTKKLLFYFMCDIFNKKELTFSKDNDIMDALAQLMYYTDEVLSLYNFKEYKEYGFLFRSSKCHQRKLLN